MLKAASLKYSTRVLATWHFVQLIKPAYVTIEFVSALTDVQLNHQEHLNLLEQCNHQFPL